MNLTQKQESLITRYLRDVVVQLDETLPEKVREKGLARLSSQIMRGLSSLGKEAIDDADVLAVLARIGPPDKIAAAMTPRVESPAAPVKTPQNQVWLGVCAGLAQRMELEPWVVRVLAVLLGLTSGPLAVLIYLGLFFATSPRPPIAKWRLAGRVGGTLAITLALHYGTTYALRFIYFAHETYLKRELPAIGEWAWLEPRLGQMLFWVLATCLPIAALSAMPLANAWDASLKRVAQAGLVLYSIALSFGIASVLVGLILNFVKDFSG